MRETNPFERLTFDPNEVRKSLSAGADCRSSISVFGLHDPLAGLSLSGLFVRISCELSVDCRPIMLPRLVLPIILLLVIVAISTRSRACDLDQMQYGCRIYNAQCRCGYGCSSEYRYNNNEDCKEALRGKRSDTCYRLKPCLNEGSCIQISSDPGFKCRCEGTGYYGPLCDKPCPGLNYLRLRGPFPYECVVI